MSKPIAVVDFETQPIRKRPEYPPKPVGVAIKEPGKKGRYLAWGHPQENNTTLTEAKRILKKVFREYRILFHHAAFDLAVAYKYMGCRTLNYEEFDDTYLLSYLYDPRDDSLELKAWCDKYLDMPPEEQDRLREWIIDHVPEAKASNWGEFICLAPGKLVGTYAIGDVDRTWEMYLATKEYIDATGMTVAYVREKKVMPIFDGMSNTGINVNVPRLEKDLVRWENEHYDLELAIKKRLGCRIRKKENEIIIADDFDITSGKQLADALDRKNKVDDWVYTAPSKTFPQGQRSTKRDILLKICNDTKLTHLLARYGILSTYLNTFMHPWLQTAETTGGYIYPTYNQVRSVNEKGKSMGTRTGRPSSTNPNLFNVPRNPEDKDKPWTIGLPRMRDYLIPDNGTVFINRDYSQQELRILAHYEGAQLLQAYLEDPKLDMHTYVQDLIHTSTGILYPRKHVKNINFGVIYGMGAPGTAEKLDITIMEAKSLLSNHGKALPGMKKLKKALTKLAKDDMPMVTWGGREYYVEPPRLIQGRKRTFEYKLLNYLIQGSAADCTKEAMIRVQENCDSRMVLQVYDELMLCAPKRQIKKEMARMKEAMESIEFEVPMLSDGKVGTLSWGEAEKYVD